MYHQISHVRLKALMEVDNARSAADFASSMTSTRDSTHLAEDEVYMGLKLMFHGGLPNVLEQVAVEGFDLYYDLGQLAFANSAALADQFFFASAELPSKNSAADETDLSIALSNASRRLQPDAGTPVRFPTLFPVV